MFVTASPSNTATFRYDYRFNGRRKTLDIGLPYEVAAAETAAPPPMLSAADQR